MWKTILGAAPPLLIAATLLLWSGCIFNPKPSPDPPPTPAIEWPDMTDRDDVIETLVLCYTYPKVAKDRYDGLLHSQYLFYLHDLDVKPGENPFMTRDEDLASTNWIFDKETFLSLSIPLGEGWEPLGEIDGETCVDCWQTTRSYTIRAEFAGPEHEGKIYVSPAGKAFVMIYVARDENDPTKWVIRAIQDIIRN